MLEENYLETSPGFPFNLNLTIDSPFTPPLLSPCKFTQEIESGNSSSLDHQQYNRIDELLARLSNVESEPFNMLLSQQSQSSQYGYFDYTESINDLLNNLSPTSPFHMNQMNNLSMIAAKKEKDASDEAVALDSTSFSQPVNQPYELVQIDCHQKNVAFLVDSIPLQQPQQFATPHLITLVNHHQQATATSSKRTEAEPKLGLVQRRSVKMPKHSGGHGRNNSSRPMNVSSSNITGNVNGRFVTEVMKRSNHNSLERRRREDLREMLNNLRKMIPQLAHNERSSKVVILEKSRRYIDDLLSREFYLDMKVRNSRARVLSLALRAREVFRLSPPVQE